MSKFKNILKLSSKFTHYVKKKKKSELSGVVAVGGEAGMLNDVLE